MLFSPSATQKQSTVSCPLIVTFALLFTWVVNAVLQNLLVIQATWILPYSICLSPPSTPNPTSRVEYFKACFYDLYCTMSMYELLFPTALSSPSPFSPCPPPNLAQDYGCHLEENHLQNHKAWHSLEGIKAVTSQHSLSII